MKLYIPRCQNCGQLMKLTVHAPTRNGLRHFFGGNSFYATCSNCSYRGLYYVNQVRAYSDSNVTPGGAFAGGLIGLVGGPLGMILGGVLGGAIGNANDVEDKRQVNVFNTSS